MPTKTTARIFLSSSFREMTEERDILARRVVPSLRGACGPRNVDLEVVDLRWGVPEDQPLTIQMLDDIVGSAIGRASVFVAFVGKRFGWVPPGGHDSTTALEIYRAIATPSLNLLGFQRDPSVWQDTTSIEAGANWTEELARGIEESDLVLFLASEHSASSAYCSKEITHTTNLRRPMITMHVDDAELPRHIAFLISDSQHLWLNRHATLDAAVAEVSAAAQRLISEKALLG